MSFDNIEDVNVRNAAEHFIRGYERIIRSAAEKSNAIKRSADHNAIKTRRYKHVRQDIDSRLGNLYMLCDTVHGEDRINAMMHWIHSENGLSGELLCKYPIHAQMMERAGIATTV